MISKKHQTTLSDEIEQKIIALYAWALSYNDIATHLKEIYGLEISNGTLSAVTDKIIHTDKEWQARPLESVYPFVWLDAIHYKIKENGVIPLMKNCNGSGTAESKHWNNGSKSAAVQGPCHLNHPGCGLFQAVQRYLRPRRRG